MDDVGNIYIGGSFQNTVDFDPGVGTVNHVFEGSYDCFVEKLDVNGNFIWVNTFGSTGQEEVESIKVDQSGNIYLTGFFEETVDFDAGAGTIPLTSNGGEDIFVQKLDDSGNLLWVKMMEEQGMNVQVK